MERQTVGPTQFLYWFQVIYGLLLGAGVLFAYRRYTAQGWGFPVVGTLVGLGLLTFVFIIYLQNLHKKRLPADYSKTCYACRLQVNRYSEFCEHCGADQIERANIGVCPECQHETYEGTAYCPTCGEDLRGRKLKKVKY